MLIKISNGDQVKTISYHNKLFYW